MPNYVNTKINFNATEEENQKIKKYVGSKKQEFDFNKLIKMPKSLNIVCGNIRPLAINYYLSSIDKEHAKELISKLPIEDTYKLNLSQEEKERVENYVKEEKVGMSAFEFGKTYVDNYLNYGTFDWYEWCINNWGTKWNACEPYVSDNFIEFETAWSFAEPIVRKLSEKFPNIAFNVEYADEDMGHNCGKLTFRNGEIVQTTDFRSGSKEAIRFACDVWETEYEEYEEYGE